MREAFRKWLPLLALVAGFLWAFITAGVHSMLFAFLPLLAFAFGYFTNWRRGLLNGLQNRLRQVGLTGRVRGLVAQDKCRQEVLGLRNQIEDGPLLADKANGPAVFGA